METVRTVLVTGGNRGIGFAIAKEFVASGHRVAVTARSGQGPEGSMTVTADVTDSASLDTAIAEVEAALGPIEVLVANAGITKDTLLMRMSDEEFESVVDTNLNGVFRVVKRVTKSMLRQKFGRVVLIGSVVGLLGRRRAGQLLRHKECFGWNCAFYHSRDRRQEHHRQCCGPRVHRHPI